MSEGLSPILRSTACSGCLGSHLGVSRGGASPVAAGTTGPTAVAGFVDSTVSTRPLAHAQQRKKWTRPWLLHRLGVCGGGQHEAAVSIRVALPATMSSSVSSSNCIRCKV